MVVDFPEIDTTRLKTHPTFFVYTLAFYEAVLAFDGFRLSVKVSLFNGQRKGGIFCRPPTLFREVQFLKADLDTMPMANLLKPYIGNTKPVHDVVAMWKLSVENLVFASYHGSQ